MAAAESYWAPKGDASPADRRVEWETNTWWLGAADEERQALSVSDGVRSVGPLGR
jgi:hypothetical protein